MYQKVHFETKVCQIHYLCFFAALLEDERKVNKQQAEESARQIQVLQGISCLCGACWIYRPFNVGKIYQITSSDMSCFYV